MSLTELTELDRAVRSAEKNLQIGARKEGWEERKIAPVLPSDQGDWSVPAVWQGMRTTAVSTLPGHCRRTAGQGAEPAEAEARTANRVKGARAETQAEAGVGSHEEAFHHRSAASKAGQAGSADRSASSRRRSDVQACGATATSPPRQTCPLLLRNLSAAQDD